MFFSLSLSPTHASPPSRNKNKKNQSVTYGACARCSAMSSASSAGMIESFVARYPAEDAELMTLHRAQAPYVTD